MPIFDKILFLLHAHFRVPFPKKTVLYFLFHSYFESGSPRGMCPLRPEEKFTRYPSNGAIWCAFVTKYFACSFSFFLSFYFKTSVVIFAALGLSAFEIGSLSAHLLRCEEKFARLSLLD